MTAIRSAVVTTDASTVPRRKVAVGGHELGDPEPIGWGDRLGDEVPGRQVAEESDLGFHSRSGREEVRHFRDDELGNDERAGV